MPSLPVERTYLLTFRTYGSWLHGDARGSVDRRSNRPGEARLPALPAREAWEREQMRGPEVVLSDDERALVTGAITRACEGRGWVLVAVNVRTNHVHAIVRAAAAAETMINDLKAFATRELRKAGLAPPDGKVWSRGGSQRLLADPRAVEEALRYVVEGQGSGLGTMGGD